MQRFQTAATVRLADAEFELLRSVCRASCRFDCGSLVSRLPKGAGETFGQVLQRRIARRGMLKVGLVVAAAAFGPRPRLGTPAVDSAAAQTVSTEPASLLTFTPISPDSSDRLLLAEGYRAQVLLRWGDPLAPDLPPFDIQAQSAALQERRFGFNSDFIAYLPLPPGSDAADEGLLWNNHEYTDGLMMFPGYDPKNPTREQVDIELAAHGASVVQIRRAADGSWSYDPASPYNRRITAMTPLLLSGPAAGDELLQTEADPSGRRVLGMLNNCGGGVTPWGTVLTAEENFNQYFANAGQLPPEDPRRAFHARYGLPEGASERLWERYYERFDVARHPNEPFRFGWIVEVDPYDPGWTPVKRTALGRLKHEAASTVVARSGRVVVYTGDDERFDYVYKFVSDGSYNPADRAANRDLLDAGTLYVARFNDDGTGVWLPLVFGEGPLTPENGWRSQADVLIRARQAADALGATKMDRPEDIEVNPVTGKVYMVMTNNTQRGASGKPGPDAANPRPANAYGHIIEATEDGDDHAATSFRWEIFLLAGRPDDPSTYFAGFAPEQVSPIANPDNLVFDRRGNLWIATDGQPTSLKVNDALHAVPTEGPERGHVKQLLSAVVGAEVTGPAFNADETALFLAIQHPGEGGSLAQPTSSWPDGNVARPSVVVITRLDGGLIGR